MSVLALHVLKEQFSDLMERVTPWTESYFVMWLDIKVAEYKVLGHMKLKYKAEAAANQKSDANISRSRNESDGNHQSDDEDHPICAKRRRCNRRRHSDEQTYLGDQGGCDIDEDVTATGTPASDSRNKPSPGSIHTTVPPQLDHPPNRTISEQTDSQIEHGHVEIISHSSASSRISSQKSVPKGFEKGSEITTSSASSRPPPTACENNGHSGLPIKHEERLCGDDTDHPGLFNKHEERPCGDDTDHPGLLNKHEEGISGEANAFIIIKDKYPSLSPLHAASVVANTSVLQMGDAHIVGDISLVLDYHGSTSSTQNLSLIDDDQYPSADDMRDVKHEECSLIDEAQGTQDTSSMASSVDGASQLVQPLVGAQASRVGPPHNSLTDVVSFSASSNPTTSTDCVLSPVDPTTSIATVTSPENPTTSTAIANLTADITTSPDVNLRCCECHREFNRKGNLDRHMRKHTDSMFACVVCSKKFFTQYSLTLHVQTKHQHQTFQCDVEGCTKVYRSQCGLKLHKDTHTNSQRFVCQYCGDSTSYKSTFDAHIAKHEGRRPYMCTKCQRCFGHSSHLSSHKLVCQNKTLAFKCQQCSKGFKAIRYLKDHEKMHLEELVCSFCGKRFNSRGGLYAHNKRKHNTCV